MNSDIEKKDDLTKPEYYVVVKDKADKALTLFEQLEVNGKPIDLNSLKTPEELKSIEPQATPEAGNLYIFSDFTQKYIKADNNGDILKDSQRRCETFLSFCRRVGVKSVKYTSKEKDSGKESKEMQGEVNVAVKDVGGNAKGSYDSSLVEKKECNLDYSYNAKEFGNYDAHEAENFYKNNRLDRLPEFSQLYDHWKKMSVGEFEIKMDLFSEISTARSIACEIGTTVCKLCSIKANYQDKKEFESVKSLSRSIYVEFFPIEYFQKHDSIEESPIEFIEEMPKEKSHVSFWSLIILAAIIVALIISFLKFVY